MQSGKVMFVADDSCPAKLEAALAALKLAEEALANSTPIYAHYPEPHVRHDSALIAVRKVLYENR